METIWLKREIGGVSIKIDDGIEQSLSFGFKMIQPIWQGVSVITDYWQNTVLLTTEIYINDVLYVPDEEDSDIEKAAELAAVLRDTIFNINNNYDGEPSPGGDGVLVRFASTKAAADDLEDLVSGQWIRVQEDETNNGDRSMYLYTGSALEFHYTIN